MSLLCGSVYMYLLLCQLICVCVCVCESVGVSVCLYDNAYAHCFIQETVSTEAES